MARYTGPKVKKARSFGEAITAKDAKVLMKQLCPWSAWSEQRTCFQNMEPSLKKSRKQSGLTESWKSKFRNYFKEASQKRGITGDALLQILESRLDNIVYRLGFAETRAQARQLVSHGFFDVNGKKVNIPSYRTRVGEVIAFRESKKKSKYIDVLKQKLKNAKTQEWLELNSDQLSGKVLSTPNQEQIDSRINTQLIVELYSR